jgi:microcystin-dependent protein
MSCESCYNGCTEIISDECVKYSGVGSVPLSITTGDSLLSVEQTLINYVVSFLDGTGIKITVAPEYYCALVSQYLVGVTTPTVPQLFTALVRAACSLQTQTTANTAAITALNANYTIECLSGVTTSSDTHEIVQATITKLCLVNSSVVALALTVDADYVKLADLNSLIAAYINGIGGGTQQYLKMVPNTVVEYYGPLTNFDGVGAGKASLGWSKIYLCNGLNGTPDKRGRVGVGAIVGVPGGTLSATVNPTSSVFNPNYALNGVAGANSVALNITQLPSHTHPAIATSTAIVTDPGHSHYAGRKNAGGLTSGAIGLAKDVPQDNQSTVSTTNITVAVSTNVVNNNAGSNAAHANNQPAIACYYIMYIP